MSLMRMTLLCALGLFIAVPAANAKPCSEPFSIRRVTNASGPRVETVVFDINGSPNRPYMVKTAHPPFIADPSGLPVPVAGSRFKEITFRNVAWTCTIREQLSLPRRAVKDVKKLGQFEGVVDYVVGYRASSAFLGTHAHRVGSNWRVVMRFRK